MSDVALMSGIPTGGAVLPDSEVIFAYDPTNDSNISFSSGANISGLTDMSGAGRHAVDIGSSRPTREVAGMTANCIKYTGAPTNSTLRVSNTTTPFRAASAMGYSDFILVTTELVSGGCPVFTQPSSGTGALFGLSFILYDATHFNLRLATKRVAADTNVNVTSNLLVPYNVPCFIAATLDPEYGTVRFVCNDDSETRTVSWASGLDRFEDVDQASNATLGRITGVAGQTYFSGQPRAWKGRMSDEELLSYRVGLVSTFGAPLRTTYIVPPAETLDLNRIYSESGTTAIPRTIEVLYGADADIEGTLVDTVTGTQATGWESWPTLGTSSGGTLSVPDLRGIATIPGGSWYLKTRKVGEDDLSAAIALDRIGITFNILRFGQSGEQKNHVIDNRVVPFPNAALSGLIPGDPDGSAEAWRHIRTSGFGFFASIRDALRQTVFNNRTGEPTTAQTTLVAGSGANGLVAIALRFWLLCGFPLGCVAYARGGRPVQEWLPDGQANPLYVAQGEEPGPYSYDIMLETIDGPGGIRWSEIDALSIRPGEFEISRAIITGAQFRAQLIGVVDNTRLMTGKPNLPVFISLTGPIATSLATDASSWTVIQELLWMIDNYPNCYLGLNPRDQPLDVGGGGSTDTQHIAKQSYGIVAEREARNLARWQYVATSGARGTATGANGPKFDGTGSAAAGSNEAFFDVTHDGGTTLIDLADNPAGTNLLNFDGQVDGIDTAGVFSLDTGRVKFAPSGAPLVAGQVVGIRYGHRRRPDLTTGVFDDTALKVPLQPSRGWVEVTVT